MRAMSPPGPLHRCSRSAWSCASISTSSARSCRIGLRRCREGRRDDGRRRRRRRAVVAVAARGDAASVAAHDASSSPTRHDDRRAARAYASSGTSGSMMGHSDAERNRRRVPLDSRTVSGSNVVSNMYTIGEFAAIGRVSVGCCVTTTRSASCRPRTSTSSTGYRHYADRPARRAAAHRRAARPRVRTGRDRRRAVGIRSAGRAA